MTEQKKARYGTFLRSKARRVGRFTDALGTAQIIEFAESLVSHLENEDAPDLNESRFKSIDRELTLISISAIGRDKLKQIEAELKGEFGFARLAEDPDRIIKRAVKRGKIGSEEYHIIRDVLSDQNYEMDSSTREAITRLFLRHEGLAR